ncbi:MAG: CBS domain-containing protein [Rhizobiales bacterium]|nr:CBS domain-containing protein [Hyphomicrobiales bacterium]
MFGQMRPPMVDRTSVAPLIAINAVVMDTETTGLDAANARVIEVGAVRLTGGRIADAPALRVLVRPDIPIPVESTRIHGFDDATVANAPRFSALWPELSSFFDDTVLIGHSIGFDLAVLERECARAKIPWQSRPSLCTRLLSEIVNPSLADFSLDHVASWLDVDVVERHSALGDATTAAKVFQKLVPLLRNRGIRTLGEAIHATGSLRQLIDEQIRAGWTDVSDIPADPLADLGPRIDTYPYRHRVREIMSSPPRFVPPQATLATVIAQIAADKISSVYVHAGDGVPRPTDTGIVTERDILRMIAERGTDALVHSVNRAMTKPLAVVDADAFVYLAIGRMNRLGIRHLGVVDDSGTVVGALSARDLLHQRAQGALLLGDHIGHAETSAELARAWAQVQPVAAGLLAEGLTGRDIAAIISRQLGAMTRRAAVLAERQMKSDGHGEPPRPYALVVLGSAGRGESLLATDQDNALIFADGAPGGPEDRWFAMLSEHVSRLLHEAAVPYCKGGIMAKNADWRGSVTTWRERVGHWISRSNPQDLLNVDIFFDLRCVHGDVGMAEALWRGAFDAAKGRADFAKLLVAAAGAVQPALGWFGRFRTEQGRIDLKKAGLFGIVSSARALAICHHVVERATTARLDGLKAVLPNAESELDMLKDAHGVFIDTILAQQLDDIGRGMAPTNAVAVDRLTARERTRLRRALESVAHLKEAVRDLLFST